MLQRVAQAAQDLQLEVLGPAAREPVVGDACAIERRLCEAIATRSAPCASIIRRVSASKLRSESALTSKTGALQPCWAASTISWSQYAPLTSRTVSGCARPAPAPPAQSSTVSSVSGESRR